MITPLPKELAMFAASRKQLDDLLEIVRAYGADETKSLTEALQAMTAERDALRAAAQAGLDALLKKNGAWGQGHDELEARAITQLQAALKGTA